eukprot:5557099-Alexandrium_andersonii.AAC.1
MPTDRADGRPGRAGWFSTREARGIVSSSEDQMVLERMLAQRGRVLQQHPRIPTRPDGLDPGLQQELHQRG